MPGRVAVLFQQEIRWDTAETKDVFSTMVKSPLGADQTQFQMFMRNIGAPSCLFRDSALVQRLFHAIDQSGSNHVRWTDVRAFLLAMSGGDRDAQLNYGFRLFSDGANETAITSEVLLDVLARVCKAIFRASGEQLSRPFNNPQNVREFVDKLFGRIRSAGKESLDATEFANLANANETMCALFTLGAFVPSGRVVAPASGSKITSSGARPLAASSGAKLGLPTRPGQETERMGQRSVSSSEVEGMTPAKALEEAALTGGVASKRSMFQGAATSTAAASSPAVKSTVVRPMSARGSRRTPSDSSAEAAASATASATTSAIARSTSSEPPPSPLHLDLDLESPRVDLDEILSEMEVLHARLKRRDEEIEDLQRKMHVMEASRAPAATQAEENTKIAKLTEQLRRYQAKVETMQTAYEELSEQNRELKVTNKKLARKVKEQTAKLRKSVEPTHEKGMVVIPEEAKAKYDGEVTNYHTLLMWMLNLETSLAMEDNGDANTDVGAFRSRGGAGTVPPTPGGVLKMAMLSKQGQYVKSWKKRFFVLRNDGTLLYFHEGDPPKPRGSIDLMQVNQFTKGGEDTLPNTIGLKCDGRDWCIAFDSQAQMKEWLSLIKALMRRKEEAKPRPRG